MATLGWPVKSRGRIDERAELDDPRDPVERAERGLELGKDHQPAGPRRGEALVGRDVLAEPPGHELAVHERQLARDVGEVAGDDHRDIGGDGGGRLRQLDAEFGEAVCNAHRSLPCNVSSSQGKASAQVSIRAWAWPAACAQGSARRSRLAAEVQSAESGSVSAAEAWWCARSSMNTARLGA